MPEVCTACKQTAEYKYKYITPRCIFIHQYIHKHNMGSVTEQNCILHYTQLQHQYLFLRHPSLQTWLCDSHFIKNQLRHQQEESLNVKCLKSKSHLSFGCQRCITLLWFGFLWRSTRCCELKCAQEKHAHLYVPDTCKETGVWNIQLYEFILDRTLKEACN